MIEPNLDILHALYSCKNALEIVNKLSTIGLDVVRVSPKTLDDLIMGFERIFVTGNPKVPSYMENHYIIYSGYVVIKSSDNNNLKATMDKIYSKAGFRRAHPLVMESIGIMCRSLFNVNNNSKG